MIYHIYFRVGAYVRYWFLHSIQDFLDQFWFFWDISIEFIQNISNLGILWFCVLQVFFVFVVFLAVSCSQLSVMASCPLVLWGLAAYLCSLIRYRQMYGLRNEQRFYILGLNVIFTYTTGKNRRSKWHCHLWSWDCTWRCHFSFINIDNNNNNKNKSSINQS